MQFSSITEFVVMGGHGPFVWTAYGVTATVLIGGLWLSRYRNKIIIQKIARQIRREEQSQ